jgi:autotransporter family porin
MGRTLWSFAAARRSRSVPRIIVMTVVFALTLGVRLAPQPAFAATVNVACGDVTGLIAAITTAAPGDTIALAAGCTYTLTAIDNVDGSALGANGLPQINKTLTILGNGSIITKTNVADFRFLDLGASANLSIVDLTLSNGFLPNQGGAILVKTGATLATTRVKFSGNAAPGGGGAISGQIGSTISATDDTFSNNDAGGTAGGGAILGLGSTTVARSTFVGNTGDLGGGIMVGVTGVLSVINSTFTANTAASFGNAIKNFGTATVTNSTISGNLSATSDGGLSSTGTFTLLNTIVADSTPDNCSAVGLITDGGHNISWSDTTCPGLNVNPNLAPLANNGGPTQTMAIASSSPALDGVPAVGASCPPTDQRGVTRPQGPACDVGAFELQVTVIPTPSPTPNPPTGPVPSPPSTGHPRGGVSQ